MPMPLSEIVSVLWSLSGVIVILYASPGFCKSGLVSVQYFSLSSASDALEISSRKKYIFGIKRVDDNIQKFVHFGFKFDFSAIIKTLPVKIDSLS